jgi:hypothetical protein
METPRLDWNSAEVRDGKLTVTVTGERPKGWKGTFERTVKLLGGGDWESVKLKSGKVMVISVQAGSEERLRHFLEGVVQQANATHQPDDTDDHDGAGDDGDSDESGEETDDHDDPDGRMTDRFRDFAQ